MKIKKTINSALRYPETRRCNQVDDYHGVGIADPFRWLEDSNSEETGAWVDMQNSLTRCFLDPLPCRGIIKDRLKELWNYEKFGLPFSRRERVFYFHNSGLQNQSVLYAVDMPESKARVLLDPNSLATDGTKALSGTSITRDGTLLAYSISEAGSDWQEWRVRDVATCIDLPDIVKWSKFSEASWLDDNSGFFYSRYDAPSHGKQLQAANECHKLYFHRLGTQQSDDTLVYSRPDQPEWGFGADVTDDGRFLVINVWHGSSRKNRVLYRDLAENGPIVELLMDGDAGYKVIDNNKSGFWLETDLNAPKGRVIYIDIEKSIPEKPAVTEIIAETDATLESVGVVGANFFVHYRHHAQSIVKQFNKDGSFIREVNLPGIGSATGFSGNKSDAVTYFSFSSYSTPSTVYRYNINNGDTELYRAPKLVFEPSKYLTKQVFYVSKDSTIVPMFITYKKGLKRNSKNATYLYGYGGFNHTMTPSFSPGMLLWMEMGGIYAVAGIRGGGEYGKLWHKAGTKLEKQNVFDDFICAAEWLIKEQYTSSAKLAIGGGSNGGLLTGACVTQRPDLFGAACPAVGVLDMLRFHHFTIGRAWTSDYGCSENVDEFKSLLAYSPLHNIKEGVCYPATFITTGDHDDRVVPAHSFKFAATLQAAQGGAAPILIRIETNAGHGAGKPTGKLIDETTDKFSFLVSVLNVPIAKLPRR